METRELHVRTLVGLGDTIYQRPYLRRLAEVWPVKPLYVRSPWPELLRDIPGIRLTYTDPTTYHAQDRNLARQGPGTFVRPPRSGLVTWTRYRLEGPDPSITEDLRAAYGLTEVPAPEAWDLPDFGPSPVAGRYAVVRPVSVRREWEHHTRNPDPGYIARAADLLRGIGYRVVVVGDVGDHEPMLEPAPKGHVEFLRGELPVEQLMALVQHASLLVGGVGWIVPAGIAARVPTVVVGGGCGGHNAPDVLTTGMDRSRIRFVLPDDYCMCREKRHDCDKRISGFARRFLGAVDEAVGAREVAA